MPDITANLNLTPTAQRHYSMIESRTVVLDLVAEAILAAGTYDILDLAVGEACIGGFIAVETGLNNGDSIQVAINGDALTGALATADLATGDVVTFGNTDVAATAGYEGYAQTTATTIDLVTLGAGSWDAGVIVFTAYIIDVGAIVAANIT